MSRRYKVREIAQQAGLSEATVDRVLHHRPNVRSRFHFRETGSVPAMVETLERSEGAVRLRRCRQPDARATAAYLTNEWLGDSPASVLVTLSSNAFRGEEEREMGFRGEMRCALGGQGHAVVEITEGQGLDATIERLVLDALDRDPTIGAVYSIGGSNVATIRAFERRGRRYRVFIAHDLDEDNRMLLRARKISAVLHHDFRADANRPAA